MVHSALGEGRDFLGVEFVRLQKEQLVEKLFEIARANEACDVHLLNAYSLSLLETESVFRASILNSLCNVPDGKPLALLTRFSRKPLFQVRGPDLFRFALATDNQAGVSHYFLGGDENTLGKLVSKVKNDYPHVSIAGAYSPPFRSLTPLEMEIQDAAIAESKANVVWIGLGTPKQDIEAVRLASSIGVLCIAVGAAFGFEAGTLARSPRWVSAIGLEWIFRLLTEPKRLWRRYSLGNLIFIFRVLRFSMSPKKADINHETSRPEPTSTPS